jgi:A/G-specific adenine glycosylase
MADFHLLITDWYRQNSRDLPWRQTNDPYRIWLSEIILQQTRVDQGMSYYHKFIEAFPSIQELAAADEEQILRLWQGLGYYSRARNLHAAAKDICEKHNGYFPENYQEIRALKGIGDYTAAAIASFAFNEPFAVVDGNVYRLLSRYFDINIPIDSSKGKSLFQSLAQELLHAKAAAIHNQAVMEIGALVCKPKQPDCINCPLNHSCLALERDTVASRPVKQKRTTVRERYFYFLVFEENERTVIERRSSKDIWQHLYQFPLVETNEIMDLDEVKQLTQHAPSQISEEYVHLLSHQRIRARFLHFDRMPGSLTSGWKVIGRPELSEYPLPRLIDRYLESTRTTV